MKARLKIMTSSFLALATGLSLTSCTVSDDNSISKDSSSVVSSEDVTSEETTLSYTDPKINVKEIWDRYDKDPDKHVPTYTGKEEEATGVVTYIGKDDHGTDSLQLAEVADGTSYVLGVFASAKETESVHVGETITIKGSFHIMSSTNMVVLKRCSITGIYR